jgi:hypothetical protein
MHKFSSAFFALLAWAALTSSAQAHIKLISPASWLDEDEVGGPQKGGPCGPGSFDDVQPVPMSKMVTTVTAGDTIMVQFDETIHHPGWFRIALAADPADFEEIEFPNADDCTYDMSNVPTEPHGNVLADGLGMDTNIGGSNRKFMEMIKLPDEPCEKCTLQVIQVMADALHSPPGCVYYHCAELKIVAKGGAAPAAGSGGSAAAGSGGAVAGAGGAGTAAAVSGSGGHAHAEGGAGGAAGGAGGATTKPAATAGTGTSAATAGKAAAAAGTAAPTAGTSAASQAGTTGAEPSDGGCSVARVGSRSSFALSALCLGLAVLWRSRRKLRS